MAGGPLHALECPNFNLSLSPERPGEPRNKILLPPALATRESWAGTDPVGETSGGSGLKVLEAKHPVESMEFHPSLS